MSRPIERQRLGELAAELQKGSVPDRREPDIREKPTFVQWAGVRLLWAVLRLIALLVIVLLVYLAVATPSVTAFGSPVTADSFALYQKTSVESRNMVRSTPISGPLDFETNHSVSRHLVTATS